MFNFSFYVAQIVLTGCHVDKIEIWRERTRSQASCLPTHTYIHIFVCEQDFLFAVSSIFFFAVCPGFFFMSLAVCKTFLFALEQYSVYSRPFIIYLFIYLFSLQRASVLLEVHTFTLFAVQNFVLFAVQTFLLFAACTFSLQSIFFVHRSPKIYFVYSVRDVSFLLSVKYFVCNKISYLQHFL